jgi:signal transduction histidine kinase
MVDPSKKSLRNATIVFWVLLLYIVAALIWWLVSLEQQNKTIHQLQREQLYSSNKEEKERKLEAIDNSQRRGTTKYIAEGITFLLLILFGAVYIYRLVRRQFQLQQQQQNFVMAITHELKTPIAVARLNLETLQKHNLPEERKEKLMATTLQETMRLDTLINNILIATQLDADAYKTVKEQLDFSALAEEVVYGFCNRYPDKEVHTAIEAGAQLKGDPILLNLLVSNLLENAYKYADKSTAIQCILKRSNGIKLCVVDEGTGIPDEEKERVFERFYRIGSEQVRTTKGTGLGLYICKKIVQSHGGTITVRDNAPKGTNFTVTFNV